MLARLAPISLLLSACGVVDDAPPPSSPADEQCLVARPQVAPVVFEVEPIEGSVRPGRAAAFRVRTKAPHGLRALIARFGDKPAQTVRLDEGRRWLVLAPVGLDEAKGALSLVLEGATWHGDLVAAAERFALGEARYPTREIRVSRSFVRQLGNRGTGSVSAEERRLQRALERSAERRMWRGSFQRPTMTGETSPFGLRRTARGHDLGRHLGQDLHGRVGYRVRAANDGRVVMLGRHQYAGRTVVLDHGGGLFTHYLHLSRWAVEEGDFVRKGQVIARMGRSGRVTGPHLHFAVKLRGHYVDPAALVALDLSDDEMPAWSERVVSVRSSSSSG